MFTTLAVPKSFPYPSVTCLEASAAKKVRSDARVSLSRALQKSSMRSAFGDAPGRMLTVVLFASRVGSYSTDSTASFPMYEFTIDLRLKALSSRTPSMPSNLANRTS